MAGRVVAMRVGGMDLLVETTPVTGTEQTSAKLEKAQEAVAEGFDRAQSAIVAVAESTVCTIGQLAKRGASGRDGGDVRAEVLRTGERDRGGRGG